MDHWYLVSPNADLAEVDCPVAIAGRQQRARLGLQHGTGGHRVVAHLKKKEYMIGQFNVK